MPCVSSINKGGIILISLNGASVSGLICGIELIKLGYSVEIYEKRQEVGNPINGPGLINNLTEDEIIICSAIKTKIGWGLRREWYEKNLAKKFVEIGGIIHLRKQPEKSSIDTKNNSNIDWYGGITIKKNKPIEFEINSIKENLLCFERGDNLIECWSNNKSAIEGNIWLEKMNGKHPVDISKLSINNEIKYGKSLSKRIIEGVISG